MPGAPLSFLKDLTIVTTTLVSSIVLALYYFHVHGCHKFSSPRKASSLREVSEILAAVVGAVLSKTCYHERWHGKVA